MMLLPKLSELHEVVAGMRTEELRSDLRRYSEIHETRRQLGDEPSLHLARVIAAIRAELGKRGLCLGCGHLGTAHTATELGVFCALCECGGYS